MSVGDIVANVEDVDNQVWSVYGSYRALCCSHQLMHGETNASGVFMW